MVIDGVRHKVLEAVVTDADVPPGKIEGVDGAPVAGATIRLDSARLQRHYQTGSDRAGEFSISAVETAGDYRLPPFELLPHLDEASLESARRFLSRYGDAVNVNTAPAEVLRAMGLPRSAVDKLLDWRAGRDQTLGTADDQRFEDLEGHDKGIRACSLNSEEAAVLALLRGSGRLTVESRYFHLAARAWGEGHDGICEIRVVLERPDRDPVRIVEWTENWLN